MFTTKAMIYSLEEQAEVTILHNKNNNDVIAEYNPFTGLFYVDDIFGVLKNQHQCPMCGEHLD